MNLWGRGILSALYGGPACHRDTTKRHRITKEKSIERKDRRVGQKSAAQYLEKKNNKNGEKERRMSKKQGR